jgi:hypothetical protein
MRMDSDIDREKSGVRDGEPMASIILTANAVGVFCCAHLREVG